MSLKQFINAVKDSRIVFRMFLNFEHIEQFFELKNHLPVLFILFNQKIHYTGGTFANGTT